MNEFDTMEDVVDAAEDLRLRKREAAKRHKEKMKIEAAQRAENAKIVKAQLEDIGAWDNLTAEMQDFINRLANPVTTNNRTGLFTQLFGPDPKVGDSITLQDAFAKSFKGEPTLLANMKRWAEKGNVVEYTEDTENKLNSVFTIVALA